MLTRLDVATGLMERMHDSANTLLLCDSGYILVMAEGRLTVSLAQLPINDEFCH